MLVLIDLRRKGRPLEFDNFLPTAVNFIRNIVPWVRYDLIHHGPWDALNAIRLKSMAWFRPWPYRGRAAVFRAAAQP